MLNLIPRFAFKMNKKGSKILEKGERDIFKFKKVAFHLMGKDYTQLILNKFTLFHLNQLKDNWWRYW